MERIPQIIHPSWHEYLQPLFDDKKMMIIRDQLLADGRYYPDPANIFKVFQMPLAKIKVVIIGQDPYINGEAIGLAFAVSRATKIPPSLQIIKNEIIGSKVERDTFINIDSDKWKELSHWVQQGVFLLNSALTVEKRSSGTHIGHWLWFTREVIKIISKYSSPVWLLWGSKAQGFKDYIEHGVKWITNKVIFHKEDNNYILEAYHPAAETRPDSKYKFTGCDHFNLCNQILKTKKQTIINW